ncbi:hypothetical protein [Thalassotalea sp. SU-HH00458]|uniref:hypothetical protein n=1 Tax=Thalassotalea sp. SU-HH00458 TaxID=3127657 RepID=UPI003109F1BF
MKKLTYLILFFVLFTAIGCSSTKTVQYQAIEKKPLISDHYLMMSLLNRPVTEDQKLMLAFAQVQDKYQQQLAPVFVNAVMITGNKAEQPSRQQPTSIYSHLIAEDINAIRMSGPY